MTIIMIKFYFLYFWCYFLYYPGIFIFFCERFVPLALHVPAQDTMLSTLLLYGFRVGTLYMCMTWTGSQSFYIYIFRQILCKHSKFFSCTFLMTVQCRSCWWSWYCFWFGNPHHFWNQPSQHHCWYNNMR